MATKKTKNIWPKVVQGSHLTVTTHEDGRTELQWDDDQLLKEVREAIASVKVVKPSVKAKANKKVPETAKRKEIAEVAAKSTAKKAPAKKLKLK